MDKDIIIFRSVLAAAAGLFVFGVMIFANASFETLSGTISSAGGILMAIAGIALTIWYFKRNSAS